MPIGYCRRPASDLRADGSEALTVEGPTVEGPTVEGPSRGYACTMTTPATTPAQDDPPLTLQQEADEPAQDTMDEQRDAVGEQPRAGDEGQA